MKLKLNTVAVAFLVAAAFLFQACVNSSENIQKVAAETELKPVNAQKNIVYEYSDSSHVVLKIEAKEVLDYTNAEEPYIEFPLGIKVTFFDKLGNPESNLESNYAKRFEKKDIWEARGDVRVVNEKGEKLNTEHLFWDVKEQKIYSDEFVKITKGEEVIMGTGFEADQNFTTYTMGNVSGEIQIEEENDTTGTDS